MELLGLLLPRARRHRSVSGLGRSSLGFHLTDHIQRVWAFPYVPGLLRARTGTLLKIPAVLHEAID